MMKRVQQASRRYWQQLEKDVNRRLREKLIDQGYDVGIVYKVLGEEGSEWAAP
jgi:hypothetical protein